MDTAFLFRSDMMIHLFYLFSLILQHLHTSYALPCSVFMTLHERQYIHIHTFTLPTSFIIVTTQLNVHLLLAVYDTTSNYIASCIFRFFFSCSLLSQLSGSQLSGFPAVGFSFQ